MSNQALYPLKFIPQLKEKVWGGNKLATLFGKGNAETIGESWELSGVKGSVSKVSNGVLEGVSIQKLIDEYQADLVGDSVWERFGNQFPLLFKFIDAKQDLSVQVHPNDHIAAVRHGSFGKTEMWYIMEAEAASRLILGFQKKISKEKYIHHLENGTLATLLQEQPVQKGDVFFIPPGTVHAIGSGILLAEIQQTSDITYRIYDWNRPDAQGNLRELHTQEALDVIDFESNIDSLDIHPNPNKRNLVCNTPYFETSLLSLTKSFFCNYDNKDSFTVYMCTEGTATIKTASFSTPIKEGETLLIPAIFQEVQIITTAATILQVRVP